MVELGGVMVGMAGNSSVGCWQMVMDSTAIGGQIVGANVMVAMHSFQVDLIAFGDL